MSRGGPLIYGRWRNRQSSRPARLSDGYDYRCSHKNPRRFWKNPNTGVRLILNEIHDTIHDNGDFYVRTYVSKCYLLRNTNTAKSYRVGRPWPMEDFRVVLGPPLAPPLNATANKYNFKRHDGNVGAGAKENSRGINGPRRNVLKTPSTWPGLVHRFVEPLLSMGES